MKRQISYVMSFIMLILLLGCTAEDSSPLIKKETITIKPTKLSQLNQNLIKTIAGEDVYLFDVSMNDPNQKYVTTWVDHYISGEKKEVIGNSSSSIEDGTSTIAYSRTLMTIEEDGTYERWNTSVVGETGSSWTESEPRKVSNEVSGKASTQLGDEITLKLNEPYSVALVVIDDGNTIALSLDALNESEEEINSYVKQYDEIFLYRVMVSEDPPYQEEK